MELGHPRTTPKGIMIKEIRNYGSRLLHKLEAETTATIIKAQVENFVWKNIISKFGIPQAFVMDNGKQFDNPKSKTSVKGLPSFPDFHLLLIHKPTAKLILKTRTS